MVEGGQVVKYNPPEMQDTARQNQRVLSDERGDQIELREAVTNFHMVMVKFW